MCSSLSFAAKVMIVCQKCNCSRSACRKRRLNCLNLLSLRKLPTDMKLCKKALTVILSLIPLLSYAALVISSCGPCPDKEEIADNDTLEELCGGYTRQRDLTGDEMEMFRAVTSSGNAAYTPLSVSTQVVAGTNYRFWCRYQDAQGSGHCWITVFKPLPGRGDPTLVSIEKVQ